jgi:hypothetical protein
MLNRLTLTRSSALVVFSVFSALLCAPGQAPAQNNFFGANTGTGVGGGSGGLNLLNKPQNQEDDGAAGPGIPATNGALPPPAPAGGDYTVDEKRMQKKYRDNMNHCKDLIRQGEAMMKLGDVNKEGKIYKKGKVLKEVGEKNLVQLKASNPYDIDKEKPIFAERKHKPVNKEEQ